MKTQRMSAAEHLGPSRDPECGGKEEAPDHQIADRNHLSAQIPGSRLTPCCETPKSSIDGLQPISCCVVNGRAYFSFGARPRFATHLNFAPPISKSDSASSDGAESTLGGAGWEEPIPFKNPQFSSHSAACFISESTRSFHIFIS